MSHSSERDDVQWFRRGWLQSDLLAVQKNCDVELDMFDVGMFDMDMDIDIDVDIAGEDEGEVVSDVEWREKKIGGLGDYPLIGSLDWNDKCG